MNINNYSLRIKQIYSTIMKFVITKNTITGESSQHMKGLISFLFFFLPPLFFLPKNGGELRVESIDLGGGRRALAPLEN